MKALRALVFASLSAVLSISMTDRALAQQAPTSPFVRVGPDVGYPDGSRIRATYRMEKGGAAIAGVTRGMVVRALAERAAARARLPTGFTLRTGATTRLLLGPAPERVSTIGVSGEVTEAVEPIHRSVAADVGEAAAPEDAKLITLHAIEYRGIPLAKGSDYVTFATGDGRLLAERQRSVPSSVDATSPTVRPEQAVAAARSHGGALLVQATAETPRLEIWVGGATRGRLAWTFTVRNESSTAPVARQYWVSAVGSPRVIAWETLVYHTHHGVVTGTYWSTSPLAGTGSVTLADLRVDRGGDNVLTGAEGLYEFPSGTGSATITSTLRGSFAAVQNAAGAVMTTTATGTPASAIDLNYGGASTPDFAQVSAFYWTSFAHRLAGLAQTELASLTTRVNIAQSCNAYWNGNSINFFQAGGSCPNTAYSDVVLHEFGHGVDAVKGGIVDGGYSEGFGDALAVLGTRQACLGRDFLGAGTCLRPATDVILWPPAPGEDVHAIGRRYAGFVWELVQQLAKTYGTNGAFDIATQLVLAANAANPSNIPDAVHLAFVADDTDGNLATCSPHFWELASAADSRRIPRPPDCAAPVALSPGATAQFPWVPGKTLSGNSNVISVQIHLDQPTLLQVVANSSAKVTAGKASLRTGFLNQPAPSTMWTNSLREVSVQTNEWSNFGSTFAVPLPAGNHVIYWKAWVSGSPVVLSGGVLNVHATKQAGGTGP